MTRIVTAAARFLTRVAAVFLVAMVALNVVDVGLRSGLNMPIFGTYEIVELLLAAVAFLAIPEVFLRDQHITIELIDQILPDRAIDWMRVFGTLCALVFAGLLGWHMIQPALDFVEFNEISMDLQIPVIWKASIILLAFGFSIVTVAVIFLRDASTALGRNK